MKSLLTVFAILALVFLLSPGLLAFQSSAGRMMRVPADLAPQTIPFSQNWSDTAMIAANDDWSGVPGITGYRGDITATSLTGVDPQTLLSPLDSIVDVNANQASPNTFTTGGVSEFSALANPVVAFQGSGTSDAPHLVISLVTTGKFAIQVSYNLRDVDSSTDNAIQPVALQYRVGTSGDFINIPEGFVADASSGPSLNSLVTPVSVTLPAAAEDKAVVQLRIITTNAVGSDEWIGVDDISVTGGSAPEAAIVATGGPLSFGTVAVGSSSSEQTFTVSGTNLTADLVVSAAAGFEVSSTSGSGFGPSVTLTPSGGIVSTTTIYARFTPVAPGHLAASIACTSTGAVTQNVGVSGTALPGGFSLTPESIDFGTLLVGSTFADTVIASNGSGIAITITSVTSTSADFTVSPSSGSLDPLASASFEVSFTPTSAGAKSGSIIFAHSGASSPDTVAVTGTGIDVAFSVTPSSIDFGDLEVSTLKQDTVIVSNTGAGTLTITSVSSTNSEFTVAPESSAIGAGGSELFVITYAPTSVGVQTGSIIFVHNGATSPDTVTVSGNGTQVLTIAAARAAVNGTILTIEGILTRSLGAFSRIQDSTGGFSIRQTAGAYFNDLTSGELRQGDLVRITGRTSEFNGLKQFNAVDLLSYARISRDNPLPASQVVTLDEIRTNGEAYESELITVHSMTIVNGADAAFLPAKTYQISDPSDASNAVALRTPNAGDSDIDGVAFTGSPVTFNGVLGQFSTDPAAGYQLLPVLVTDIDFTDAVAGERALPTVFALKGNYPNPFNPTTKIAFDLPREAVVTIDVYNILGARVAEVVPGVPYQAGSHEISFDAAQFSSGVYYYRLTAGDFTAVDKMVLLK